MPHHKSCKKRLITSRARNERNRQNRAMMRTKVKQYRANIGEAAAEDKPKSLSEMYSLIDTQARKGLLPKRRAARLKSRLAAAAAK
ncbi:MAG: 30S ribosomal protein S20 [Krumholzibacteria bacterium]|nr:30S ribosomal protein S20 [Candidatus Krumholzibacteria bacterium]